MSAPRRRRRPISVPPAQTRAPIPSDALRASYGAHIGDQHAGKRGYGCTVCRSYVHGIAATTACERVTAERAPQPPGGPTP